MNKINYFSENTEFNMPKKILTRQWIQNVIHQEGYRVIEINFIFCSDAYLHAKNLYYLQHDTLTDVMAFSTAETEKTVEGDIYISIDRVQENAKNYQKKFLQELDMVMIHGVLHFLGYNDKSPQEKAIMTQKEQQYISIKEFFKPMDLGQQHSTPKL